MFQSQLEQYMDDNHDRPNREMAVALRTRLNVDHPSYDITVMMYNDLMGFHKHCFNGTRCEKLHYHGKCGIVFYCNKASQKSPPSDVVDRAREISNRYDNAETGYYAMESFLAGRNIGWYGLACWTRGPDLWRAGKAPVIWEVGSRLTVCVLTKP